MSVRRWAPPWRRGRVSAWTRRWFWGLLRGEQRRQFEAAMLCSVVGNSLLALSAPPWLMTLNGLMVCTELLIFLLYLRRPQGLIVESWLLWAVITSGAMANVVWVGGLWSANIGYLLISSIGLLMVVNLRAVMISLGVVSVGIVGLTLAEFAGEIRPNPLGHHELMWPLVSFLVLFVAFLTMNIIVYETQRALSRKLDRDHMRLTQTDELLRRQHHMQEQFVAAVSHELRAPIHAILGFVQTIQSRSSFDRSELELLDHVESSSKHLLLRINELLDFSQLQAGKLRLHMQPTRIIHDIEQALPRFRALAQEKGLRLQAHLSAQFPEWVDGERERLIQVLSHLLDNAIKFTERGQVQLHVEVLSAQTWVLTVSDTGAGIASDELDSVFDRMSPIKSRTRREMGGSGLSLAIAKALVELMGGSLSVQSRPGRGTTFCARFPLRVSQACTPCVGASLSGDLQQVRARVLIVDDSPINRLVARNLLHSQMPELDITEADCGEQAIARASQEVFDVILMDLIMPGLTGSATCARLLQQMGEQAPPVWGLTADASPQAREQCLASGMRGVILKPFDAQGLLTPILEVLSAPRRALSPSLEAVASDSPSPTGV